MRILQKELRNFEFCCGIKFDLYALKVRKEDMKKKHLGQSSVKIEVFNDNI